MAITGGNEARCVIVADQLDRGPLDVGANAQQTAGAAGREHRLTDKTNVPEVDGVRPDQASHRAGEEA